MVLNSLKKRIEESDDVNSTALSICIDDYNFYKSEFKSIIEMDTSSYKLAKSLALESSILKAMKHLLKYIKEIERKCYCQSKSTFILISDEYPKNKKRAKRAITKLNN